MKINTLVLLKRWRAWSAFDDHDHASSKLKEALIYYVCELIEKGFRKGFKAQSIHTLERDKSQLQHIAKNSGTWSARLNYTNSKSGPLSVIYKLEGVTSTLEHCCGDFAFLGMV